MGLDKATYTMQDYAGQLSTFAITLGQQTAANFDSLRTKVETLRSATLAITKGKIRRYTISDVTEVTGEPVTFTAAARESKWLVLYRDTTQFLNPPTNTIANPGYNNLYSTEIPTADRDLLADNIDSLVLADGGVVAAFVTAFEDLQKSPTGGNVSVVSIKFIGRNL